MKLFLPFICSALFPLVSYAQGSAILSGYLTGRAMTSNERAPEKITTCSYFARASKLQFTTRSEDTTEQIEVQLLSKHYTADGFGHVTSPTLKYILGKNKTISNPVPENNYNFFDGWIELFTWNHEDLPGFILYAKSNWSGWDRILNTVELGYKKRITYLNHTHYIKDSDFQPCSKPIKELLGKQSCSTITIENNNVKALINILKACN